MRKFADILIAASVAYLAIGFLLTFFLSPQLLAEPVSPWQDPSMLATLSFWVFILFWPLWFGMQIFWLLFPPLIMNGF